MIDDSEDKEEAGESDEDVGDPGSDPIVNPSARRRRGRAVTEDGADEGNE